MSGGILSPRAVTAGGERFAVSVRLMAAGIGGRVHDHFQKCLSDYAFHIAGEKYLLLGFTSDTGAAWFWTAESNGT